MSVSLSYSAIPPSSTLYIRLQRQKSLAILVVSLFSYGNGLFNKMWRDLYILADEKNEEILVEVT